MRQISADFFAAQHAGQQPLCLAILTSKMTRRVYAIRHASDTEHGGAGSITNYDGTAKYGDGTLFGAFGVIADSGARVIGFGGIRETLTPEKANLLASLTQTEIGTYSIQLDNADGKFSDILKDESFLNNDLEILFGYRGLPFSEFKSMFTGSVEEETLSLTKLRLVAAGALAFKTALANVSLFLPPYALYSNTNQIGAELLTTYSELSPIFFGSDSWTLLVDFSSDSKDVVHARELFKIQDETYQFPRIELGINSSNLIYFNVATDILNGVYAYFTSSFEIGDDPTQRYSLSLDWRNGIHQLLMTLNGTQEVIDVSSAPDGFDRQINDVNNSIIIGTYLGGSVNSLQWDASWYAINNTGTALPTEFVDILGGVNVPVVDGVWQLW